MAAETALRRAWSAALRRDGPWRRPSPWVPSAVPRVRRALDLMARRLGRVEAIKGASKLKTQALSSHLAYTSGLGWNQGRGGQPAKGEKTQENVSNSAVDSQNNEQVYEKRPLLLPKSFYSKKTERLCFI